MFSVYTSADAEVLKVLYDRPAVNIVGSGNKSLPAASYTATLVG